MAVGTWKFPLLGKTTHPPIFSAPVRKKLFWDSCFALKSFKIGKLAISRSPFGSPHLWPSDFLDAPCVLLL
jgi:hypothetical protein